MIELPKWEKKGLIFCCENRKFFKSHSTRPIPILLSDECLRIFFSSRSEQDIPYPTFIDVEPNNPCNILAINENPMLDLGRTGTFDDSGITPVSIVKTDKNWLMYYVGWKRRRYNVTIETSIGVAALDNSLSTLSRIFEGPILGQNREHPILVAAPFVVFEDEVFRMWYCSGSEWRQMTHGPEMIYTIFEAHSDNGLDWKQTSPSPKVPYLYDGEVISAPWVVKLTDGKKIMWYSTRGSANLVDKNYMAGLAFFRDGGDWERRDSEVGIDKSQSGWDSEMICYPAIMNYKDKTYMFYSGNGVGKGGIGYAVADRKLDIIDW